MTPQLQQAIRLLQLSTIELQTEVQEALDSNPMLEMAEEGESESANYDSDWVQEGSNGGAEVIPLESGVVSMEDPQPVQAPERDADLRLSEAEIPEELPVDSSWDDIYDSLTPRSSGTDSEGRSYELQGGPPESLRDHLAWQLDLTRLSDTDRLIAESIVDAIGEDGYLSVPFDEIFQGLPPELGVEMDEAVAVLHRIQHFDPPGVGARDLRECLLIQLQQLPRDTPRRAEAERLIRDYLVCLGNRDYAQLMRRMRIDQKTLQEVIALIQSLNPRPGSLASGVHAEYVIPDVVVRKVNGAWRVELNQEALPRLRINRHYASMVRRADSSADNTFLKGQLQEARWFIKSLQSRHETLLKVATCIVERQRGFFEHGEEAMKPLVLHDIAETVGMHESTISRVTTKKYMFTPRGIFELKYFFSSHVSTATGDACSATAIRALIKKLVAAENPGKPLSDSKIADILSDQGINVARRTVAKYREAMSIPPSNERKRLV